VLLCCDEDDNERQAMVEGYLSVECVVTLHCIIMVAEGREGGRERERKTLLTKWRGKCCFGRRERGDKGGTYPPNARWEGGTNGPWTGDAVEANMQQNGMWEQRGVCP
jgi:hypothetical protein